MAETAIGASIDAISSAGEDEIGIVRMHKDGKRLALAQCAFPVTAVIGASKHAGETTLLAGVIAADTGEDIR